MNYEAPLTSLVWITSVVSIALTYGISYLIIPTLAAILRSGEAGNDYLLRNASRRRHSGIGEGVYLYGVATRKRSRRFC